MCYFGPWSIFCSFCKRTWYQFPNVYILSILSILSYHCIYVLTDSVDFRGTTQYNNFAKIVQFGMQNYQCFSTCWKVLDQLEKQRLIIKCLTVSYLFLMMNVRKRVVYTCWFCFLHESCIRFLWTLHWNS